MRENYGIAYDREYCKHVILNISTHKPDSTYSVIETGLSYNQALENLKTLKDIRK